MVCWRTGSRVNLSYLNWSQTADLSFCWVAWDQLLHLSSLIQKVTNKCVAPSAKVTSFFFPLSFSLQQTQIPDYAELVVKFLDALIDTYLPGIEEEGGEESQRTPTSPYPPIVQSQLSITANLNLSNSMTSLATSQHSPGQKFCTHTHVYARLAVSPNSWGGCL